MSDRRAQRHNEPDQDVTDAELAVLHELWDGGPATIRHLTEAIYPDGGTSHYATIQKLLERLEAKRCVTRDRTAIPHRFTAEVAREDLIGLRLRQLADQLCEGSLTPLLVQLVRGRKISAADRQALRALVDELRDQAGAPKERSTHMSVGTELLQSPGLWGNVVIATVLAITAWAAARLGRRPAWVHLLCLLALLKLVSPPIVGVPVLPAAPTIHLASSAAVPADPFLLHRLRTARRPESFVASRPAAIDRPAPARTLATLWLCGSAGLLLLAVVRIARFRRLLRATTAPAAVAQSELRELGARLGLRRLPRIDTAAARISPMLLPGFPRARLLLPAGLMAELPTAQRRALLLHELAHYRRRDHLLRPLELVVGIAFWWLPLTYWLRHTLRAAEEQCCDAWVLWAGDDNRDTSRHYADALLATVDFLAGARAALPPLGSGAGELSQLKRRLTMILRDRPTPRLGRSWPMALLLAAAILPLTPDRATSQEPQQPATATPTEGRTKTPTLEEALRRIAELEKIVTRIEKGDGLLGRLVADPALGAELQKLLATIETKDGTLGKLLADQPLDLQADPGTGISDDTVKLIEHDLLQAARDPAARVESRVPLLSDIPLLSHLFTHRGLDPKTVRVGPITFADSGTGAADRLARDSGVNIVLTPAAVGVMGTEKLELHVAFPANTPLTEVLEALTRSEQLAWTNRDGVILIGTITELKPAAHDAAGQAVVQVYDVRDLLQKRGDRQPGAALDGIATLTSNVKNALPKGLQISGESSGYVVVTGTRGQQKLVLQYLTDLRRFLLSEDSAGPASGDPAEAPEPDHVQRLEAKIAELEARLQELKTELVRAKGRNR